jgi:hypothetical protein
MGVKLVSSSGGSVEINPPATASNFTATMPAGTGNVVVNGVNGALVSGTAVASTSGTSIDFTGIPSWVKRITVMFNGVSLNGSSSILVQLGDSGGVETTGYVSTCLLSRDGTTPTGATSTSGFVVVTAVAANLLLGNAVLTLVSGTTWVLSSAYAMSGSIHTGAAGGNKTLSDTLDRVRITTVNGTDTFDAGSINILYE